MNRQKARECALRALRQKEDTVPEGYYSSDEWQEILQLGKSQASVRIRQMLKSKAMTKIRVRRWEGDRLMPKNYYCVKEQK